MKSNAGRSPQIILKTNSGLRLKLVFKVICVDLSGSIAQIVNLKKTKGV